MKNREVVRFVVAPSGYGKTLLALEYAETMRSWLHVFWVNCQSPCFVRDLDEDGLGAALLSFDPEAALVVFDDLPLLDSRRQEMLSKAMDELLAKGCEVIVTCLPTCDIAMALQRDRLCLRASELLLDDAELDALRSAEERARCSADQLGPAQRVPVLAWTSGPGAAAEFMRGVLREELPADVLLAVCGMLVLGEGSVAELPSLEADGDSVPEEIRDDYPHLGLGVDGERFEAPLIDVEVLASSLKRVLPHLAGHSSWGTVDDLVAAWASSMLRMGDASRACAVIREMCSRRNRVKWLVGNGVELVRKACFLPVVNLSSSKDGEKGGLRARQDALEALCRWVLGDEAGAVRCAKRCAFIDGVPNSARILGLLVIARFDEGVSAIRAQKALSLEAGALEGVDISACSNWSLLVEAWRSGAEGLSALSRFWMRLDEAGAAEEVLCVCASWMFSLYRGTGEYLDADTSLALRRAERFVRARMEECDTFEDVDYFVASACLAIVEAKERGMVLDGGMFGGRLLYLLHQVEMHVASQRRQLEELARCEKNRREDWVATHPASLLNRESHLATASKRSVPVLALRLFGGFEVSIGDEPIDHSLFKRQNARALLAMLAVNQGREVSREVASEALWPNSSDEMAHKNFYTVWSNLRRALSLPDGTCPYLIRHRYGCSLDSRFVRSDVNRFNEICRELLFGAPNLEHWSLLFAEIDRDFPSDLMPSEKKNSIIVKARDDYRARLVDSLVAATIGAIDSDNPQWGVWFARAAIERDETREDAYVALMRAQVAGNQRTAAMMTYLNCRRALSKHLGIDPAPETTALYESLLDGN